MKRVLLIAVLLLPLCRSSSVHAVSATPAVGQWSFCTTESAIGCIESFKTTDDNNQEISIASQNDQSSYPGISFSIECSSFSTNQSQCDSKSNTPRDPRPVGQCGFTEPAKISARAMWAGHVGRGFKMTVRTGDFDPVFSFGNGISGTTRIENPDGTFKFEWSGFFDEIKSATIPASLTPLTLPLNHEQLMKDFFATATVSSSMQNSIIYVYPAAYLRVAVPAENLNGVWVQTCTDLPMKGLWVDANSQMFSYSLGFYGKSKQSASKFSFAASSPHFLPGGSDLNPARFNMFIPDSYVASIGYSTETFNISALKLTVADNQVANPTLTRRTGGFALDFGIAHYSTPNPQLEFLNSNWTYSDVALSTPATAQPSTATTVFVPLAVAAPLSITSKTKKTLSGTALAKAAEIAVSAKSKITLFVASKYSKKCKISGTSIKTLSVGTCVVKVSVLTASKKTTSKSVTITVK